jgi:hypothetical protein
MITIFGDFRQFSAIFDNFLKTNVMIKCLHNLAVFWIKNANIFASFLRKYLKNHNIVPRARFLKKHCSRTCKALPRQTCFSKM